MRLYRNTPCNSLKWWSTTGAEPILVTCQGNIILLIRCIFNKEIKKQVAGAGIIQMLRHAMVLAQEADIKLKKYEGLGDNNHH